MSGSAIFEHAFFLNFCTNAIDIQLVLNVCQITVIKSVKTVFNSDSTGCSYSDPYVSVAWHCR